MTRSRVAVGRADQGDVVVDVHPGPVAVRGPLVVRPRVPLAHPGAEAAHGAARDPAHLTAEAAPGPDGLECAVQREACVEAVARRELEARAGEDALDRLVVRLARAGGERVGLRRVEREASRTGAASVRRRVGDQVAVAVGRDLRVVGARGGTAGGEDEDGGDGVKVHVISPTMWRTF